MAANPFLWSITASDNDDADAAVPFPEGMSPGAVNNGIRSLMAGVARLRDDINGTVTTTGSANSYAATSNCEHAALSNGLFVSLKASFTNTGAATLNLNTLGQKTIRVFNPSGETELIGGEIRIGGTYQFRYDTALNSAAGAWLLLNPTVAQEVGTIKVWPSDTAPTSWLFCNGSAVSRTTFAALFSALSSGSIFGSGDGSTTFNVPDLRGRTPFGSDVMAAAAAGRITNAEVGFVGSTLGAAGGAQSITLATTQIPSHNHSGTSSTSGAHTPAGTVGISDTRTWGATRALLNNVAGGGTDGATGQVGANDIPVTVKSGAISGSFTGDPVAAHSHVFTTSSTGGGGSHINMPPAIILNFIIRC